MTEAEPNDDILTPNARSLDTWIDGAISAGGEADYFQFTYDGSVRDVVRVDFQNQSTTLAPEVEIFNQDKVSLSNAYSGTKGANLMQQFSVDPGRSYFVKVTSFGSNDGGYRLRLSRTGSFDRLEPNDDILNAADMQSGTILEAGILDGQDADYFRFTAPAAETLRLRLENLSTTLAPQMIVYSESKSELFSRYDYTNGADLAATFSIDPGATYYVHVLGLSNSRGGYRLTVDGG